MIRMNGYKLFTVYSVTADYFLYSSETNKAAKYLTIHMIDSMVYPVPDNWRAY